MDLRTFSLHIGEKEIVAEFSNLAAKANGSVLMRAGDSAVLIAAVMSEEEKKLSYLPLIVDYEERFYAAGAILGSRFVRREGRPSDDAILAGRAIDRTIRPLFVTSMRNEVQVTATVLALGEEVPDVLSINGASLALLTSDIPWNGPVSALRVGKKVGSERFDINPSYPKEERGDIELELLVCGAGGTINMIEVGAREASEKTIEEALRAALPELEKIERWQKDIQKEIGKQKRIFLEKKVSETAQKTLAGMQKEFEAAVFSGEAGGKTIEECKKQFLLEVAETEREVGEADAYFEEQVDALMHAKALFGNERVDGRSLDELRPLEARAGGFSPMLHGSGLFFRGETHVFSTVTLGSPRDAQLIASMESPYGEKRFMHHYNFPPFSAGETGRAGSLNRRAVGHGALVEKALLAVIPGEETFPYAIRVVSETFSSNGSTSMASVCAATLALMDAGVPVATPVAGISIGLMYESPKRYALLTDIQGPEDHHGDMDFKVAGTAKGVTAIQLDVKIAGVPLPVLVEALARAKDARAKILKVLGDVLPEPRATLSPRAPRIERLIVPKDKIGLVIGTGGQTIRKVKEETGVTDISVEDDGSVFVTGPKDSVARAVGKIETLVHVFQPGEKTSGIVSRITDFGAFIKLTDRVEGLVHISEIAPFRIDHVPDALSLGESVPVVIKDVDSQGRIALSIKDADPEFAARKGLGKK